MLKVTLITSKKQEREYFKRVNEETAIIMDDVYRYYMDQLKILAQKKMFHDWWKGKYVFTEEYRVKNGITQELEKDVYSCIAEATSRGFG